MDYKKLQNGSDIRGVAMEGVEGQEVNLTKEVCRNIGRGFAVWLSKKLGKKDLKISIGRDSRLSGENLLLWAAKSMAEQGATVYDVGMASTPAMFMSTVLEETAYDGAVMVTASHLPFNRNGYKFFTTPDTTLTAADQWESSNINVASIDPATGEFTIHDTGKTVITAYFGNLKVKAKLKVN